MSDDRDARFDAAVTAMTQPENRFDVTIICTTDDYQAEFWMSKLHLKSTGSGSDNNQFPMVLAVSEDWDAGGAGNGLGTLYAWQKACDYAKTKFSVDLEELLGQGKISTALYHTAGKGTRMAPLPASENNNKPGVVRSGCGRADFSALERDSLESNLIHSRRSYSILETPVFASRDRSSIDCLGGSRSANGNLCSLS